MLLLLIPIFHVFAPCAVSGVPAVYDQRQSGNSNIRIGLKDAVFIAIADEFGDYDYNYDYSHLTIKPQSPSEYEPAASSTTTSEPVTSSTTPSQSIASSVTTSEPVASSTATSKQTTATESPAASPRPDPSPEPTTPQNASIIIDSGNSTLTFVPKPGNESSQPDKLAVVHNHVPVIGQDYQIPVIVVHGDAKENTKLLPVKIVEKSAAAAPLRGAAEEAPQLRHCSQGFFLDSHNRCKRIRQPLRDRRPQTSSATPETAS